MVDFRSDPKSKGFDNLRWARLHTEAALPAEAVWQCSVGADRQIIVKELLGVDEVESRIEAFSMALLPAVNKQIQKCAGFKLTSKRSSIYEGFYLQVEEEHLGCPHFVRRCSARDRLEVKLPWSTDRRGHFGMELDDKGVVTSLHSPASPAELLGVLIGMRIVEVNGRVVTDKRGIKWATRKTAQCGAEVTVGRHLPSTVVAAASCSASATQRPKAGCCMRHWEHRMEPCGMSQGFSQRATRRYGSGRMGALRRFARGLSRSSASMNQLWTRIENSCLGPARRRDCSSCCWRGTSWRAVTMRASV